MDKRFKDLAKSFNITPRTLSKIYKLYWRYIREHIEELPLFDIQSEEEFNKLKVNFNLPGLGKLYCTYKHIKSMRNGYSKKYKYKKNTTNV